MPETPQTLFFVLPGSLDTPTGGYAYDRRIVEGLRAAGSAVDVLELTGTYPFPGAEARRSAQEVLAAIPSGATVVVDGLAGGALPDELASEAERLNIVALVHHPLFRETGLTAADAERLRAAEAATLAHARKIIATSDTTATDLARDFPATAGKIAVVRPGTDPAAAGKGSGRETGLVMLCVASVIPRKGHLDLLTALETVDGAGWRLICAGSTELMPDHASVVAEARERHPHRERIEFLGAVSSGKLADLYASADLFVLASRYEGYGMVFAEALARGVPVVGTTGGAIPETVPEGAGILVEPGDTGALGASLETLMTDRALLADLRCGALSARADLPTWETAVRAFREAVEGAGR